MNLQPRAKLWALWTLIAFGALNIQATPAVDPAAQPRAAPGLDALLVVLRDDGDTRRYFAYAQAMLGRPYDGYFVRPADQAANTASAYHHVVTPAAPLIPWRDFEVEYPPGVLAAALPPALMTNDFRGYHYLFGFEMEALLTLACGLSVGAAKRFSEAAATRTLSLSIVMLLALGIIAARRYDALVAAGLSGVVYGLATRRAATAGAWLAAAIVAKGAPLLVAPAAILALWGRGLSRAVIAGLVVATLSTAGYFALAGGHAFDALLYHADRPIQIESPYGAALLILRHFRPDLVKVVHSFGSHNVAASFEPALRTLSFGLTIAGLLAVYAAYALGMRNPAISDEARFRLCVAAMVAALVVFITFGKVFSPQYLTWLLPLGATVGAFSTERSRILLIAGFAAGQFEYPFLYQTSGALVEPMLGALALLRAALTISAAVSLLADAYPRRSFEA